MTTWTVTGSGNFTYTGSPGVDRIDLSGHVAQSGALYIDSPYIASFSIVGRGTVRYFELIGSPGSETLYIRLNGDSRLNLSGVTFGTGWSDDDRLIVLGSSANETLIGTPGDDVIGGGRGQDSVNGGDGSDVLSLYDLASTSGYRIVNGATLTNDAGSSVRFAGIEALSLNLGSGNDSIAGLAGVDFLSGNGGNDSFDGAGGDDVLSGGAGADSLTGGGGGDRLLGEDGSDILAGNLDGDRLDGGAGADQMYGGSGDDTYQVGSAKDRVYEEAGGGDDRIFATVSFDLASNGNGLGAGEIETLLLQGGNLNGRGNGFANRIEGTTGANVLQGRGGADDLRLIADSQGDVVQFRAASDSTGPKFDTVRDFDAAAEDRLDIVVGGVDVDSIAFLSGGSLSLDSFDLDAGQRLNAPLTPGGAVQALLWDPTGGDLDAAAARFLVVDLDNSGGYTAGKDLVVRLLGLSGTLDLSDFVTL